MIVGLIVGGWLLCGLIHYPIYLAYFERKWPRLAGKYLRENRATAIGTVPFGPIALAATLSTCGVRYGLKWW